MHLKEQDKMSKELKGICLELLKCKKEDKPIIGVIIVLILILIVISKVKISNEILIVLVGVILLVGLLILFLIFREKKKDSFKKPKKKPSFKKLLWLILIAIIIILVIFFGRNLSQNLHKVCVYPCNAECGSKMTYLPTMGKIHTFPDICVRNPTENKIKITYYHVESSIDIPKSPKEEIKAIEVEPNGGEKKLKGVYRFETPKEDTPFFMSFCIKKADGETICSEKLKFTPQGERLE